MPGQHYFNRYFCLLTMCYYHYIKKNVSGSSVSICGVNGHWSSPAPICSNICTQLKPSGYSSDNRTVPANSVDCPYSDIPYSGLILSGRTCHYFCDPPYFPVFPRFRECLSSGEFNRENPVCNIPETGGTYL